MERTLSIEIGLKSPGEEQGTDIFHLQDRGLLVAAVDLIPLKGSRSLGQILGILSPK